jgi:hypothetical protein
MLEMFEIRRTLEEQDIDENFVAIGNLISENPRTPTHSALIIKYNNSLYEFHFTGRAIELKEVENDYFHKITQCIHRDEVAAFIALCKHVLSKASPTYGFFYSGEFYDSEGNFIGNNSLGERMTCVGFCLNVLKGFLEAEYLNYSDWSNASHNDGEAYLLWYCGHHGLNINDVRQSHRRISPLECLVSCFYSSLPISKRDIDAKTPMVWDYILNCIESN